MDTFSADERAALAPYFTDLDGPVFALVNLPEVVKGALFARYSRSAKSLRRLFLDEFLGAGGRAAPQAAGAVGVERAEKLYERVFSEYGDDSVAQLGGVHLACEDASNILTKVLERGRLGLPRAVARATSRTTTGRTAATATTSPQRSTGRARQRYARRSTTPSRRTPAGSSRCRRTGAHASRRTRPTRTASTGRRSGPRRATRCAACSRPPPARTSACTATGQSYEALLLRMRAHPLAEVRDYADRCSPSCAR